MSVKRALIENFFAKRDVSAFTEASIPCKDLQASNPLFVRSQSSQEANLKVLNSRPNSAFSYKSSNQEKFQLSDPSLPNSFKQAVKKLTLRSLQNLQKSKIDESSQNLIHSFLLILSFADPVGPASQVKSSPSKVFPAFNQYLKNPALFIQTIRKLPNSLKDLKIFDIYCQKAQILFKTVDFGKLSAFFEIFELVQEALAYLNLCKVQKTHEKLEKTEKPKIKTLKKKRMDSYDFNIPKENQKHIRQGSTGYILEEFKQNLKEKMIKNVLGHKESMKAERFLVDSRVNKRIQEKLNKFIKDKNGEYNKESVIKEFVSGLPCAEVNKSSLKFIELYFNRNFK